MKNIANNLTLSLLLIILLFTACRKEDEPEVWVKETNRTILAYIIADNSLDTEAPLNLRQLEQGFIQEGTNMIAFLDSRDTTVLMQIQKNRSRVLKTYKRANPMDKEVLNSTDPEVMKSIILEVQEMFPANSYGLILWSHAYSWLPANQPRKRMFGEDGTNPGMNIPDLANALPFKFDFIIIDACYMGGMEVVYELRKKSDYLLAAPSSILASGFPYNTVLPKLTNPKLDLIGAAEEFYKYYNGLQGDFRSATISLIKTSELEALAALTRNLIPTGFSYKNVTLSKVQILDEDGTQTVPLAYDMLNFFEVAFPNRNLSELKDQINKTVEYKANTPKFLKHPINTFCGLTVYVPSPWLRINYNQYYKTLEWYKDSGFKTMMDNTY